MSAPPVDICPELWLFAHSEIKKSATFLAEEMFLLHSIIKHSLVQIWEKSFIIHSRVAQLGNLESPVPAAADEKSHSMTVSTSPKNQT